MSGRIFISYRKADEAGFTGRLYDRLESKFGADRLFMDVTGIKPGRNFVTELEEQVAKCDILLAIIGKGWVSAKDEHGRIRLNDPEDWVRVEIDTALRLGKLVIPVLANGAAPPKKEEVPVVLADLLQRQFIRVLHDTFNSDAERLVQSVEEAFREIVVEAEREAQARKDQASQLGDSKPLTREQIDLRRADAVLPQKCVRIVLKDDAFPNRLGESEFVFVGDHEEYRGRFLKDLLRDMFWGLGRSPEAEYLAIKFKLDSSRLDTFSPVPATKEAIRYLVSNWNGLELPRQGDNPNSVAKARWDYLCRTAEATGELAGLNGVAPRDILVKKVGELAQWQLIVASGRGRSEYAARHILVRDQTLSSLDFEVQRMGRASDLVALI